MKNLSDVSPKIITVQRAAKMLDLSVWTLRGLAYRGAIGSVKIGARLLIPVDEVNRLIAENTRPRLEPRQ
jgi:excisionase family DNA binding protein